MSFDATLTYSRDPKNGQFSNKIGNKIKIQFNIYIYDENNKKGIQRRETSSNTAQMNIKKIQFKEELQTCAMKM